MLTLTYTQRHRCCSLYHSPVSPRPFHYPHPTTLLTSAAQIKPTLVFFFFFFLLLLPVSSPLPLSPSFYRSSCPRLLDVVQRTVTDKQISSPTTAAGTLRLLFHDCFPNGCDASVLVSTNPFNTAERDADINLSLPGDAFDVIVRIKTALELECPGVVSCADVLALAARDLLVMLGGPFVPIRLGRRDSLTSRAADIPPRLPRSNSTVAEILTMFAGRGFSVRELVALSGAHTVGFAHCKEFASRLFNKVPDPTLNPRYAEGLRSACADYQNRPTIAAFMDIMSPNKFDNMYYQNMPKGLGLLATDTALWTDPRTRPYAQIYGANQTLFFEDFSKAMVKLTEFGVKTGKDGEIRRRCDQFNTLTT